MAVERLQIGKKYNLQVRYKSDATGLRPELILFTGRLMGFDAGAVGIVEPSGLHRVIPLYNVLDVTFNLIEETGKEEITQ